MVYLPIIWLIHNRPMDPEPAVHPTSTDGNFTAIPMTDPWEDC